MFKLVLFLIVCDSFAVDSAVIQALPFKSPNRDDAQFWRTYAENYLKSTVSSQSSKSDWIRAKNVIIFVGDGMGMTTVTAGRIFKGQLKGKAGEEENLAFDTFPNTGFARTYNVDKQVPDSAGTATALFTGVKTNYRAIGADSTVTEFNIDVAKLDSIMVWAQKEGKRTGFVTNTRVTHATPAASYAHVKDRDWECDAKIPPPFKENNKDIARQLIENEPGKNLNVIFGGCRNCFGSPSVEKQNMTPKFNGSMEKTCIRADGKNLTADWINSKIYSNALYVETSGQLMEANVEKLDHILGLFNNNHMSYEGLRDNSSDGEPSLSQMTQQAIIALTRKDSNGFVLMVEGGRIDQAHHQNWAKLALIEMVEFDNAINVALDMTKREDTLIIVTADHSHAFTFNGYPKRGNDILGFANKSESIEPYETLSYANGPGFNEHISGSLGNHTWIKVAELTPEFRNQPLYRHLAAIPLEDETHGGEDVPVYGIGPGSNLIRGSFEQNYVAYVISYSSCIGPAKSMNPACSQYTKSGAVFLMSSTSLLNYLMMSSLIVVLTPKLY